MLGKILADKNLGAQEDAYVCEWRLKLKPSSPETRVFPGLHTSAQPSYRKEFYSSVCSSAGAPSLFLSSTDLHIAK